MPRPAHIRKAPPCAKLRGNQDEGKCLDIGGDLTRSKACHNVTYASSAYRHDIEGLRAFAVTPVILHHAHLFCPGGFVGVDVFFVISGYLITKIIQKEFERGRFTLMSFYQRRIRRIFPALFVMFAISSAFACVLLLPHELRTYGRSLMASAAFASNIFFRSKIDYFDATSEDQPLLHIWSLAVEEQFYIFWPLILVAMNIYVTEKTKTLALVTTLVVSLVHSGVFGASFAGSGVLYAAEQ